MSFQGLLNQELTIVHRSQTGPEDRDGTPTWVETRTTAYGYKESVKSREYTDERDTQVEKSLLILPANVSIDKSDAIEMDGITYQIDGKPERLYNPRTHSEHHVECYLQEVS